MHITSKNFENWGTIPQEFTCDGDNVNPQLSWSDVPERTRCFALTMNDPDIPDFVKNKMGIDVFDHWVLYNLSKELRGVKTGDNVGTQGLNSSGKLGYTGPCPPDAEHRYFFKLFALDAELGLPEGLTKEQLESAMEGHVLAEAELMSRYSRESQA